MKRKLEEEYKNKIKIEKERIKAQFEGKKAELEKQVFLQAKKLFV